MIISIFAHWQRLVLIAPVKNAWPEGVVSALKIVKSRIQSTMKNDIFNALLNISINLLNAKVTIIEKPVS